jgi:hypothetical protein
MAASACSWVRARVALPLITDPSYERPTQRPRAGFALRVQDEKMVPLERTLPSAAA